MKRQYWVKLWIDMLEEERVATLPDRLWRRWVELLLIAKLTGRDGVLPGLQKIAWRVRLPAEQIESELVELARAGLVEQRDGDWVIPKFSERQAPVDAANRKRRSRGWGRGHTAVTAASQTGPPEDRGTEDPEDSEGQRTEEEAGGLLPRLHDFGLRRAEAFLQEFGPERCEDVLDFCQHLSKKPAAFVAIIRGGEEIPVEYLNHDRESVRRRYTEGPFADFIQH